MRGIFTTIHCLNETINEHRISIKDPFIRFREGDIIYGS